MKRPTTTLYMLMSVDGKISTGASDNLDADKDFPNIDGVGAGLHQYYEIERTTDKWSINSGRTQAKIGVNSAPLPKRREVSFVVIDNSHMEKHGVEYFCALAENFMLVTQNPNHPAFSIKADNMYILLQDKLDLNEMLEIMYEKYGANRATIQTGGTINSLFLRGGLIDYANIVIAPAFIGGKDTPTLIDGVSFTDEAQLKFVSSLTLEEVNVLENSYIQLKYKVNRK